MALRLTLVGAGERGVQWGREVAAAAGWDLVAMVEPDVRRRQSAVAALGLDPARAGGDLDETLDANPCDAVIVCTPPDHHRPPAENALSRGLAVLVEKPFALDLASASGLVKLAEARGAPLMVGQNYRYTRAQRTVRRLVHEGALGEIRLVVCHHYRTARPMQAWLGGIRHGALWELAVHHLDALRHTLGREVTGVMAHSSAGPGGPTPGATLQVILTFEGGANGTYTTTYESVGLERIEGGRQFHERVVGDRATLHVLQRWLVLSPRNGIPRPVRRGPRPLTEEALLLGQLERAVTSGQQPEASGRDNLGTIAVLEACALSADEGRWVNPQELMAAHA